MDTKSYWEKIDQKMDKVRFLDRLHPLERLFEEKVKIGLDIGTYSIKMVQLKDTPKGPTLVKLGYKEIPKTLSESKASGTEQDSIASVLRELWQEQKIKGRRVRLAVSDSSIYSRDISIPRVTDEELVKAIKWQAEKYIPFSIDDAIVDFQTLRSDSKKGSDQMEIIVVAAKKETVNKYLTVLKEAKLIPTNLDVCPFAVVKSFLKNYPVNKEEMVAVIDIGAKVTSVIIAKRGSLQFVRNIELAGSNFTQVLAQGLNVEKIEAEKIKKRSSLYPLEMDEKKEGPNIFPIIEPLLVELAQEINRSFAYCETEQLTQRINKVILYGGGARLKGLDKFLKEKLRVPVEIGNPFKDIAIDRIEVDTPILDEVSSSLMAALGAAL